MPARVCVITTAAKGLLYYELLKYTQNQHIHKVHDCLDETILHTFSQIISSSQITDTVLVSA